MMDDKTRAGGQALRAAEGQRPFAHVQTESDELKQRPQVVRSFRQTPGTQQANPMEMYDSTILSSDHLYLSIGRNIRHLRKKKNLTQDQLAELIDGDQKYISRIESGKAKASLLYYLKIANALCVSLDYLLIDCISAHYGLEGADDLFQNFIGETEEQLAREILIAIQHYLQRKE